MTELNKEALEMAQKCYDAAKNGDRPEEALAIAITAYLSVASIPPQEPRDDGQSSPQKYSHDQC